MLRSLVRILTRRKSLPKPSYERQQEFEPWDQGLYQGVYRLAWYAFTYVEKPLLLGTSHYFCLSTTENGSAVVHRLQRQDRFTYHADLQNRAVLPEHLSQVTPGDILKPFGLEQSEFGHYGALCYEGGLELVMDTSGIQLQLLRLIG